MKKYFNQPAKKKRKQEEKADSDENNIEVLQIEEHVVQHECQPETIVTLPVKNIQKKVECDFISQL